MAEQVQIPQQNQTTPAQALTIGDTFTMPFHTDGIYSIRMVGDSVRIMLYSHMAAANEPVKPVLTGSINMSLQSFLRSVEVAEDYIKHLEEAGIIKKTN